MYIYVHTITYRCIEDLWINKQEIGDTGSRGGIQIQPWMVTDTDSSIPALQHDYDPPVSLILIKQSFQTPLNAVHPQSF